MVRPILMGNSSNPKVVFGWWDGVAWSGMVPLLGLFGWRASWGGMVLRGIFPSDAGRPCPWNRVDGGEPRWVDRCCARGEEEEEAAL